MIRLDDHDDAWVFLVVARGWETSSRMLVISLASSLSPERLRNFVIEERVTYTFLHVARIAVDSIWEIRNRLDDELVLLIGEKRNWNAGRGGIPSNLDGVVRKAQIFLCELTSLGSSHIADRFSGDDKSVLLHSTILGRGGISMQMRTSS